MKNVLVKICLFDCVKKMKRIKDNITRFIHKIGTLNLVLLLVGAFFIWFNWQMITVYRSCGSMPETYACAVVAATIGECGICGWIRTTKDKRQDRKWQKQDEQELKNNDENDLAALPDEREENI